MKQCDSEYRVVTPTPLSIRRFVANKLLLLYLYDCLRPDLIPNTFVYVCVRCQTITPFFLYERPRSPSTSPRSIVDLAPTKLPARPHHPHHPPLSVATSITPPFAATNTKPQLRSSAKNSSNTQQTAAAHQIHPQNTAKQPSPLRERDSGRMRGSACEGEAGGLGHDLCQRCRRRFSVCHRCNGSLRR